MLKRYVRLAAVVLMFLALVGVTTGCKKAGEEVAEKITEGVTGADDIEIDDDEITITTDDGDVTLSGGDNKLPDGFPKDFPMPDVKNTGSSSISSGGETSFYVNLETTDSVDDMKSFFMDGFADEGWTVDSEADYTVDNARSVMLGVTKGTMQGTLIISDESGKTVMALVLNVK